MGTPCWVVFQFTKNMPQPFSKRQYLTSIAQVSQLKVFHLNQPVFVPKNL